MAKPSPSAADHVPLSQSELNKRLWHIYQMAIAAADRYEREQAAQTAQEVQSTPSARER